MSTVGGSGLSARPAGQLFAGSRCRRLAVASATPSITPDGLLFVGDFSGFLYCFDADTGKLYWTHDMKAHMWGSTLVADGKLYVGDEDGDFVVLAATKDLAAAVNRFRSTYGYLSEHHSFGQTQRCVEDQLEEVAAAQPAPGEVL